MESEYSDHVESSGDESSGDESSSDEMDIQVVSDALESNSINVEEDNIYKIGSDDGELDRIGIKYDDIEIESNVSESDEFESDEEEEGGSYRADIHGSSMDYVEYTQNAVDKYNSCFKHINGSQLELVKIKDMMITPVAGDLLDVTFDAIDFGDGNKIKTYQAEIWLQFWLENSEKVQVCSFGLKPFHNEQEDNQVIWFWKEMTKGNSWREIHYN